MRNPRLAARLNGPSGTSKLSRTGNATRLSGLRCCIFPPPAFNDLTDRQPLQMFGVGADEAKPMRLADRTPLICNLHGTFGEHAVATPPRDLRPIFHND